MNSFLITFEYVLETVNTIVLKASLAKKLGDRSQTMLLWSRISFQFWIFILMIHCFQFLFQLFSAFHAYQLMSQAKIQKEVS